MVNAYGAINIFRAALSEHLDGAVRQVADETRQLVPIGHPVGGETKADALDAPGEDYVPGNHS